MKKKTVPTSPQSNVIFLNKECKVTKAKKLVAFVASKEEKEKNHTSAVEKERVRLWSKVYDSSYSKSVEKKVDADFNADIWKSNYSGEPIPIEQMKEWVSSTVQRILETHKNSLRKPKILEIGCGTGLLLYPLLPHVEAYVGTDISEEAIDLIAENCSTKKDASKLKLYVADADDLSGLPSGQFDIIIINSVVQYFPSADYFLSVIDGLKPFLSSSGVIFIGDVICFPLCNAFNYETQFAKASTDTTVEKLLDSILTLTQVRNSETYYDPRFFHLLPGKFDWINSVETQLRKGDFYNEMNNFRFDVIIRNVENSKQVLETSFLDWEKDALTLAKIQSILATNSHEVINIVNIPNARIFKSNRLIELLKAAKPTDTVGQIKNQLDKEMALNSGLQPSLFWELENQHYSIEVDWDYEHWDGKMSVRCIQKKSIVFKRRLQNFSIVECSNRPAISCNESDVIQELKKLISQEFPADRQPKEVFVISPRMYAMFN